MAVKIIDSGFDPESFDRIARHPLQSWQWGKARAEMGIELLRVGEFDGKELINIFQLTLHKIPYTNFKIGYLPRSVFPSRQVLEFLAVYARKNNIIFIKIEPYALKSQVPISDFQSNLKFRFSISKHPLFPKWTQILDLTSSEQELLKRMHHKTRYNIRLAQKRGVIVKEMSNNEGFKIFSKLYFETCKRQKYFGHTPKYHKTVWENLKNGMSHILIAFYKDVPLASYELFYFHDTLYYPYGGTSTEYRNLMASNLLMWEAIRFGKKLEVKKFDMWGSLPQKYNPDDAWAGFTRFKEGYGGIFTEFIGSYDLVANPALYEFYGILFTLRQYYLKLRR